MIPRIVLLVAVFHYSFSFAQISDSEMETLKTNWRIHLRENGHLLAMKALKIQGRSDFSDSIQRLFIEDTFVVENLLRKQVEKESTNLGINKATIACSVEYEQLADKYYAILVSKMSEEDKKSVELWQQTWKTMIEKERVLIGHLMQERYSGGGIIHSLEYTNRLMMQQKNHLLTVIDYLTHMI
jgi:hypothetical protein